MRRIASETASHVAAERCGIVASPDGGHAAIVEPGRIVVVELDRTTPIAEIGVATALDHTDVAWIGAPPRLLVLSRHATHSTVHLIDLDGPRARAEIQIEGTMRIGATVGAHALVIGATSTAVLTAGDTHLTPYQFPGRSLPTAAGAAARLFVVAIAGAIEEWDPQQRTPRKRLRLPRPAAIAQVGGTERVVWMTTQQDPARIDVIAQVNRAQPKVHELPEPIAHVSAHPQRDLLVCLGRETGSAYVVDLEGRAPVRTLELQGISRADTVALFAGPTLGVVAARAGQPLAVFVLDGRGAAPAPPQPTPTRSGGAAEPPRAPEPADQAPAEVRRSSLYDIPLVTRDDAGAKRSAGPNAQAVQVAPAVPVAPAAAHPLAQAPAVGRSEPAPPPPAIVDAAAPARPDLASLQLRGIARADGPSRLRRLGTEPAEPSTIPTPPGDEPPRRRTRGLADAPTPPPVIRPPIALAVAALAPRTTPNRCSPGQYQALLEHYRHYAAATALRAIARDWDSGRLAFSTHDRPPFEAEVLGLLGRRSGLATARVVESTEALEEATGTLRGARAGLAGRLCPLDVICAEHGVGKTG